MAEEKTKQQAKQGVREVEEVSLTKKEKKEVVRELEKRIGTSLLSKAETLKTEFKKQTTTAIIAAFGLIIALVWKDVITDLLSKIDFIKGYGLLVTAVIITLISILGILLMSKWANSGVKK